MALYEYDIVDKDTSSRFIELGSISYPAKFEGTLGSYNVLRGDVNAASALAVDPAQTNFFSYTNNYIVKFVTALQTDAADTIGADLYDMKAWIPKIQDGTALYGTSDALAIDPDTGLARMGFFTYEHVQIDTHLTIDEILAAKIAEDPNYIVGDLQLYLRYRNDTQQWSWTEGTGLTPPEDIGGTISTENAIATWSDDFGTGLLNTGVIITTDNEMHGQGVSIMEVSSSFTLEEVHRGKVLRYINSDSGGGDITVPVVTVGNKLKGFQCTVLNDGTGTVVVKPGAGATLNFKGTADDPPAMDGPHSAVSIINLDTAIWGVYGDLAAAGV